MSFGQILLVALGPAIVTACVGILAPWLIQRVPEGFKKRKLRSEKVEDLVTALDAHKQWLDRKQSAVVFGNKTEMAVTPMGKIYALTNTHFPSFNEHVDRFVTTATEVERWIHTTSARRLAGESWLIDGLGDAWAPYVAERNDLIAELREYAQR